MAGWKPDPVKLQDNPVFLLLAAGTMIGLTFPLGKLAAQAGIPPIDWAFLLAASAAFFLAPIAFRRGSPPVFDMHFFRFAFVAGLISYVAPNLLLFTVLPHLGAGFTGLLYTLSPIFTLAISLLVGMRAPNRLGLAGIAVGFCGALMLAWSRGDAQAPASLWWVGIAILIPLSLATGNVYRTVDWPKNATPLQLAVASNAAAALILFTFSYVLNGQAPVHYFSMVPLLSIFQMGLGAGLFMVFFHLQRVGGPVYLSQIGYVAAAVGLLSGLLMLGERYGLMTWLGAAIIAVGIGLTIRAQIKLV